MEHLEDVKGIQDSSGALRTLVAFTVGYTLQFGNFLCSNFSCYYHLFMIFIIYSLLFVGSLLYCFYFILRLDVWLIIFK